MKHKRRNHGCFSVKEQGKVTKVYVFGGNDGSSLLTSTEVLNVSDLTWSDGPSLPYPMYGNAGVSSNDKKYEGFCVGGYNSTKFKTVLGLENANGNQRWVEVGQMKEPREDHTVVNAPPSLLDSC